MGEEQKREPVRPADALGTLSRRAAGSRVPAILIAVLGIVIIGSILVLIFRGAGRGDDIPQIPAIEL